MKLVAHVWQIFCENKTTTCPWEARRSACWLARRRMASGIRLAFRLRQTKSAISRNRQKRPAATPAIIPTPSDDVVDEVLEFGRDVGLAVVVWGKVWQIDTIVSLRVNSGWPEGAEDAATDMISDEENSTVGVAHRHKSICWKTSKNNLHQLQEPAWHCKSLFLKVYYALLACLCVSRSFCWCRWKRVEYIYIYAKTWCAAGARNKFALSSPIPKTIVVGRRILRRN